MGSFLDKVGLQHFVKKIKGLLSGYLPLSGGTMTGAIKYGTPEQDKDLITLTKNGLTSTKHLKNNALNYESSISPILLDLACQGENTEFGEVRQGSSSSLSFSGLSINVLSDKKSGSAYLTSTGCAAKKFTLSVNNTQKGLIANDSETVVKELSDEQVDKLLVGDTSVIDGSKYYVSGANLGKFAQSVAKDNSYTIIYAEYGNVEVKTSKGNVTVESGTNTRIDEICPVVSGQESITSLVYKGYVPNEGLSFYNMTNLKTIEVSDLNTSNVTDMSNYFSKCVSLDTLGVNLPLPMGIKYWDTRKVESFDNMFFRCNSLMMLDLRHWNTQKVTHMSFMFAECTKLSNLNLEGWDTRSVNVMEGMFTNCKNMSSLQLGEGFGRMQGSVGSVDFSMMSKWTNTSVDSLTKLYNRKMNGMSVVTLKLSAATKNALGEAGIRELTDNGYTIA